MAARLRSAAGTVEAGIFDDWPGRMRITFTGYDQPATLTNFPVHVVLSNNVGDSGFVYDEFTFPDGGDLRFADSTETVELHYERVFFCLVTVEW